MEEENPFNNGAPIEEPPPDFKNARRQKQSLIDPSRIDREPPNSPEAEEGVVGCCLLSPLECIPQCIDLFNDRSDVFYDLRRRVIYEMCVSLYDNQKAIDTVTILQALRDAKQLDSVGGIAYLAGLPDAVPSAANLLYYVEIVKKKHALRSAITTCTDVIGRAYEFNGELSEFLDKFAHDANKLAAPTTTGNGVRSAKQLVPLAVETMERIYLGKDNALGLTTGFPDLDQLTLGLRPGEVTVVAARPSTGKSSYAMNVAEHVVMKLNQPVGVFSLEMPAEQLMIRMICARAKVDLRKVMSGKAESPDVPKLSGAGKELVKAPLYIDDSRGLSILQAKAKARHMAQQHGIKLFIFDYLQLMHSTSHRSHNRQEEVSDVSRGIHDLAGELNLPILLVAQLNRDVERDKGRRPRLSDLRESGAIEQDADTVLMLYRSNQQSDDDYWSNATEAVPVNLLIAKQRNGPTGEIPLVFHRSFTRFESPAMINKQHEHPNDPTEHWPGENV